MNRICLLSDLNPGESATVGNINKKGSMRRRLHDLGFTPGAEVKCVLKSPGGDMRAYKIKGAVIALRKTGSSDIRILPGRGNL